MPAFTHSYELPSLNAGNKISGSEIKEQALLTAN